MHDLITIYPKINEGIRNLLPPPVIEHCERLFRRHPETMLEIMYANRGPMMGDTLVYSGLLKEGWAWMHGDAAPWNLPILPDVGRAIHYWSMIRPATVAAE